MLPVLRGDNQLIAGIACAIAVLIRPNLAPLALVPLLMANRKLLFAAPVALGGAFLALTQWFWYGSPLQSGYGSAGDFFAISNVGPNPFATSIGCSPLPRHVAGAYRIRTAEGGSQSRALALFALLVVAAYLDVRRLRSLVVSALPAARARGVPVFAARVGRLARGAGLVARADVHRARARDDRARAVRARSLDAFSVADQQRRIVQLGDFGASIAGRRGDRVRRAKRLDALLHRRPIVRWEAATPETLSCAIATLERGDRPVWFVLDAWENDPFRAKFAGVPTVALDWPAAVKAGTTHRTSAWQVSDRARFIAGENLQTVRLP